MNSLNIRFDITLLKSSHIACTIKEFTSGRLHNPQLESLSQWLTLTGRLLEPLWVATGFPDQETTSELELHSMTAVWRSLRTTPAQSDVPVHNDTITTSLIRHLLIYEVSASCFQQLFPVDSFTITKSTQALVLWQLSQIASSESIQSQLYLHDVIQSNPLMAFHSIPRTVPG